MIDFQILEQLVTFHHTGTLCEASKKLHISQSALTRGMQKLEAEFGVSLFSRTKNSISLTDAGQLAVAEAELILRQCENMKKRIQDLLFFYLNKQHPYANRKSLSVKEMNGENMLLFQDIGFWHDLVLEKMPDSRFLMQSERYSFQELIVNSTMSVFTSDAYPDELLDSRRVRVSIDDPEFHVTYYLVCKERNREKFWGLFASAS